MKQLAFPIFALAALFSPVTHAETPAAVAPTTEAKLPGLPWHMINLWWHFAPSDDFKAFSIDVDISRDVPAETYNLYISTIFGQINGDSYYGGIQTNVNGWDAMNPKDQKRLHGGHGFIFSRWSESSHPTLDDVRATPGGFVEAAGYEGHFVSGRRPYPWKAGKYTFALRKMDTQLVEGKPYTWVGCFVKEYATGEEVFVNALRFAGDKLTHNGTNSAFLEFYATDKLHAKPDLATLPALVVSYSNLRLNDAPIVGKDLSARFIRHAMKRSDGLAAPISPNLLHVKASEDGTEVTCTLVNKPFPDDEEPDRMLWKKDGGNASGK